MLSEQETDVSPAHYETLSMSSLIARGEVPAKHKLLANNYMVIKKIFGFTAVHPRITNREIAMLSNYGLNTLESSNIKQINQELVLLKKWASSYDSDLRQHADEIFEVRVKELKYLYACNYINPYNEIYDGHRALEKYIEFIAN